MKKYKQCETLAENKNGDFIEVNYTRRGTPNYYMFFLANNGILITLTPEDFKHIKSLFWSLTKNFEPEEEEDD